MEVTKAYSKLSRTSKIELFAKMVNGYYSFSTFAKDSILDVRLGSTNVLNKKMNVFFGEEIFCLHWNNSLIEKCHDAGGRWKFQENRMPITHINTFIKISSINSFESWLLVIRLVSWQMCSVSFNPPRDTPALTSRSPLPRYLPILQYLEEIYSFQYFFGRSCYYYQISHHNTVYKEATKKRPHCDSFSLFFRKNFALIAGSFLILH